MEILRRSISRINGHGARSKRKGAGYENDGSERRHFNSLEREARAGTRLGQPRAQGDIYAAER